MMLGWLLRFGKYLLTLAASGGLGKPCGQTLSFCQAETLKTLPIDIQTAFRWMGIDPKLVKVTCCQACFAMYPIPKKPTAKSAVSNVPADGPEAPRYCIHQTFPSEEEVTRDYLSPQARMCGAELF